MPKFDLVGRRFGNLTVVKECGRKNKSPLWECLCDCGQTAIKSSNVLLSPNVKHYRCRSCYLLSKKTHGCAGEKPTREYRSWYSAKKRCRNPKNSSYKNYGGRGISFSPVWDDFAVFLSDMGECPEGHTLERINNNGNYEPGNCRWATRQDQVNNRRVNVLLNYKGETLTVTEWTARFGQKRGYISRLLLRGYTAEEVFDRLEQGQVGTKPTNRCEKHLGAKLNQQVVNNLVQEYNASLRLDGKAPKGTVQRLASKYGLSKSHTSRVLQGLTYWADRQLTWHRR